MGEMAAELIALRPAWKSDAREILDHVCLPWIGCDAEFEAPFGKASPEMFTYDPMAAGPWPRSRWDSPYVFYTDPNGPLGLLINAAFYKNVFPWKPKPIDWRKLSGIEDRDTRLWRKWSDLEAYFSRHYNFC